MSRRTALTNYRKMEKFHLVGTAGFVTLDFAISYPGRLRSLILLCRQSGVQDAGHSAWIGRAIPVLQLLIDGSDEYGKHPPACRLWPSDALLGHWAGIAAQTVLLAGSRHVGKRASQNSMPATQLGGVAPNTSHVLIFSAVG